MRGRRDECVALDGARAGRSAALVLEGEAGVGKTALLDYAIASASDLRVLLRKVFTKLDINSRNQLGRVLTDRADISEVA